MAARPPSPNDQENYPLDCWYVAATSDEVSRHLLSCRVLGRSIVLYRERSGSVVAMRDRCPHRAYPLSRGRLEGDRIVCGYHGFAYDSAGRCVAVPSQENVPYGVRVETFPVREEPPFVWIWLGRAAKAERRAPPRIRWLADDEWAVCGGTLHVDANYLLLHENVLDLVHLAYVQPEISPVGLRAVPPRHQVEVTETSVSYSRTFPPTPLAEWQADLTGLPPEHECRQRESGRFVSPALWTGGWEFFDPSADSGAYELGFAYAFTPEGPGATHVFWRGGRRFETADPARDARMVELFEEIFRRRKQLLEAIAATSREDGDARDVNVVADAAALKARRIVSRMLAHERGRPG